MQKQRWLLLKQHSLTASTASALPRLLQCSSWRRSCEHMQLLLQQRQTVNCRTPAAQAWRAILQLETVERLFPVSF
jgi:hypothetical protein